MYEFIEIVDNYLAHEENIFSRLLYVAYATRISVIGFFLGRSIDVALDLPHIFVVKLLC